MYTTENLRLMNLCPPAVALLEQLINGPNTITYVGHKSTIPKGSFPRFWTDSNLSKIGMISNEDKNMLVIENIIEPVSPPTVIQSKSSTFYKATLRIKRDKIETIAYHLEVVKSYWGRNNKAFTGDICEIIFPLFESGVEINP